MNYINIQNALPLRDRGGKGKGYLHAMVYGSPDRVFVEQSSFHKHTIQRVLYPNGKLVITRFDEVDGGIKELDEAIIYLWGNKEGDRND